MLRLSSAGPARAIGNVVRYRYPMKQQQQRFFASIKMPRIDPTPTKPSEVKTPGNLPGSKTPVPSPAAAPQPTKKMHSSSSPPTPSSITPISPTKIPQSPAPSTQAAPPTSTPAPAAKPSPVAPPPPPPPPPPGPVVDSVPLPAGGKKPHRFRKFLITLTLLTGVSFVGGVFYSLKSDNFHDFFTEYIPFGEEVVLYVEEREFRRRFPKALSRIAGLVKPESAKVTVPRSSGATWKVFDPEDGKLGKPGGPHISAKGTEEKKKPIVEVKMPSPTEAKVISEDPAPKSDHTTKVEAAVKAAKPTTPAAKVGAKDTHMIPAVDLGNVSDPVVQDLVQVVNSIISLVNHSGVAESFDSAITSAKSELVHLNDRIAAIRDDLERATEEKLKHKDLEFATAAQGLLAKVNNEVVGIEHRLNEEFEHEREQIIASYRERLRNELDRSQKVLEQRLRNELLEQAIEMKRKFIGEIEERVENERNGRLGRLQELSDSVDELSKLSTGWGNIIDANLKTQQIQVALEAVRAAYKSPEQPKPFLRELAALKEVATDDEVVRAAIASINPRAYQVGVSTPSQLVDRFRRVAEEVRKAALLPEYAGVAGHAASWVLSKVLFRKQGLAQGDDVESILTRTKTFLEEGDVDSAAREMNQLRGWARRLAGDWLKEARLLLEVQQAIEVISAEARLQSLRTQEQR